MNSSDKKLIIAGVVVLIFIGIVGALGEYNRFESADDMGVGPGYGIDNDGYDGGVSCTMEAKLCPDGSYVGRTGPNCEFSPCPTASSTPVTPPSPPEPRATGTLKGSVSLGPTCPVMRNPPDPQCADKPYVTTVIVTTISGKEVGRQKTDAGGNFSFSFLPGSYNVTATGGTMLPRCETQAVTLTKGVTSTIALSCDTGIR